ncbi:MAG TPA: HEAT repeat domain-containing protein [Gemmatimonadales bacterium]|nr:HEAT repeat domain-containing protein [Gemmatimonadales bacterium]
MYRLMFAVAGALFTGALVQEPASLPAAQAQELAAGDFATVAPAPWLDEDPADSLYRLARESLNRGRYREALNRFQELRRKYPDSGYTPDALYWEAFALYRLGTRDNLRAATEKLAVQKERYPTAATRGDAEALQARINIVLARIGDVAAEARMAAVAAQAAVPPAPPPPASAVAPRAPMTPPSPPAGGVGINDCENEDEVQVMALHSLMQNDPDRALPILRKVMARRDEASKCLRRHALFVVASRQGADVADLLLSAARSDPDPEVRQSAVFWLSRVEDPQAVAILDSVLRTATDQEVQQAAIFALGRRNDARSTALLRAYALRSDIEAEVRQAAIVHLLRSKGASDPAFARRLYEQAKDVETRTMVLMLGMHNETELDTEWLTAIASDKAEDSELRRAALLRLSRSDLSAGELMRIVESFPVDDEESTGMMMMIMMQHAEDPAVIAKALELARSSKNEDMRRAAVMLLSRSKDPRATQYLAELLEQ